MDLKEKDKKEYSKIQIKEAECQLKCEEKWLCELKEELEHVIKAEPKEIVLLQEKFPHLFNFDKAKNNKRYKSKGHSIEFIYTDKIQIDNVKEIGNGILRTNTCKSKYNLLRFLRDILSNTGEAKHLKIYDV